MSCIYIAVFRLLQESPGVQNIHEAEVTSQFPIRNLSPIGFESTQHLYKYICDLHISPSLSLNSTLRSCSQAQQALELAFTNSAAQNFQQSFPSIPTFFWDHIKSLTDTKTLT